jgi:hypothetical protein
LWRELDAQQLQLLLRLLGPEANVVAPALRHRRVAPSILDIGWQVEVILRDDHRDLVQVLGSSPDFPRKLVLKEIVQQLHLEAFLGGQVGWHRPEAHLGHFYLSPGAVHNQREELALRYAQLLYRHGEVERRGVEKGFPCLVQALHRRDRRGRSPSITLGRHAPEREGPVVGLQPPDAVEQAAGWVRSPHGHQKGLAVEAEYVADLALDVGIGQLPEVQSAEATHLLGEHWRFNTGEVLLEKVDEELLPHGRTERLVGVINLDDVGNVAARAAKGYPATRQLWLMSAGRNSRRGLCLSPLSVFR